MTDPVSRTAFYEGEILPAADLTATVDYSRNQMARHDRYLHSWGIAVGLDLVGKPAVSGTTTYMVVTVKAGVAIDGTGREIVVPDDVTLNPSDFQGEVVPLPEPPSTPPKLYPVFLVGLDQPASPSSNLTGACNSSQPTRTQETYNIVYGNPGDELNLDQQQGVANTADGPGDGFTTPPWRVLLGFVQWSQNPNVPQFLAVTQVGRQYVGVNAAEVTSGSGTLLLATHPAGFSDPNPIMAVQIQEAPNDGSLVFGKLNPDGSVTAVLTVASNGDLTATGQISGAVTPGSMQVQSGIAFDGMTLPLPIGIDPADVDSGKVTLHTHLSLRMDQSLFTSPKSPPKWVPFPYECTVDSTTRQIHCRIQWCHAGGPFGTGPIVPAFCDYLVIAAVPASGGSGA
jgi:hypothetical protein